MIEIVDIILLFFIFLLFISGPISAYSQNILSLKIDKNINLYFNLLINLNLLLYISILPLKLSNYIYFFYFILLIFFIKNYLTRFEINNLAKNFYYLIIFFITYFIISIDISAQLNLSWDAKWFWYIKSLYFYQDNTFNELVNYTYNDFHPHFGSYIWAFFRKLSINQYEYFGRLFYLFLYLGSLLLISRNIFKDKFYNLLIFIVLVVFNYKYYYFSGLQEVLIFSLLIIISKLILDYLKNKNFLYLLCIALSINLILWTKSEGIAYFFITILCINLIQKLNFDHRIKFNIIAIGFFVLKIFVFKIFDTNLNNQPYYIEYLLSLDLNILLNKLLNISIYLFYYGITNIIFILFPIILLFNYRNIIKDQFIRINLFFFILNLLFIYFAYILRDMEVVYSLKTTIDRLIFSSSGFYILFILNYFKKLSSKII